MSKRAKAVPVEVERKMINRQVDTISGDLEGSLNNAVQYLERLALRHPDAILTWEQQPYEDYYHYVVSVPSPETDDELAQRLRDEARWKAQAETRERAEFERLSAKFGHKA